MVPTGPMDNCELELVKGVQPSSHHSLCILKPVKPDKRLVVRPNNESSTAQVGAKLYTHGDSCQHLSFRGAVSALRRPESTTAVRNDPFLAILDLAKYSTQAKITSVCIQHVVPGLSRKSQNGSLDERISQSKESSRALRSPHERNVLTGQCHQRFCNVSGTGQHLTSAIFLGSHFNPRRPTTWLKNGTDVQNKWHLVDFSCSPYILSRSKIDVRLSRASQNVVPKEMISSRYTRQRDQRNPCKT